MSTAADPELARLYDDLSRYQWSLRRLRGGRGGLEMRKPLGPSSAPERPAPGTADLSSWIDVRLLEGRGGRLLDLGTGFGALLFDWLERHSEGSGVGLTASGYQVRRARAEAARRGLGSRAEFREQSYAEPVAGEFDAACAVEALFHASDLAQVLGAACGALRPGGRIAWVEDMAADATVGTAPEARLLLDRWSTEHLHTEQSYREACSASGLRLLEVVDLTDQVLSRQPAELERSARRMRQLQRLTPIPRVRRVLRAFEGGVALEQLYAAGSMRYLAMVAERPF